MPGLKRGRTPRRARINNREHNMPTRHHSIRNALLAATMLATPAFAADVTPERLVNADKEPQDWLMNHPTYDGPRFSPLTRINRDTAKGCKLTHTVAPGAGAAT